MRGRAWRGHRLRLTRSQRRRAWPPAPWAHRRRRRAGHRRRRRRGLRIKRSPSRSAPAARVGTGPRMVVDLLVGPAEVVLLMHECETDCRHMRRALELALGGEGQVEPNPMVGCVIARGDEVVGEGFHRRFGGPHAEIEALGAAGGRAADATLYVTLEPCCHHGKTPPCTRAVVDAGVQRVVVAQRDPFLAVQGRGIAELQAAGIAVELGLLAAEARRLNAPYLKLVGTGRPWIVAKWAMTLDGKIATRAGESRWISGAASRERVHLLRGRMDAIMVGRETAVRDDPLLTARPPGPRRRFASCSTRGARYPTRAGWCARPGTTRCWWPWASRRRRPPGSGSNRPAARCLSAAAKHRRPGSMPCWPNWVGGG